MTLRKRAVKSLKHMNLPVSFKTLDENHLSDARNIFDNKGVAETRYGIVRFNTTSLGGAILSVSFFKKSTGARYRIAKVGTVLYSVAASGASTAIKTGLTSTTKHTAVTLNDRHIIAIESDGLFSWDGTLFNALGQAPPTTGTAAVSSGGSLTDANNFKVGLTFYASGTGFETNVFESNQVTTASPNKQIDITSIPATATNTTIDKVRVYLKNVTSASSYLFVTELSLGTTSYTITTTPTSTQIPPTTHAPPISGGAKYLALFGKKLAYAGNSTFPNEVFISEDYLPDAFNDIASSQVVLQSPGQGPITGIGVGTYDTSFIDPFLVIFKRASTSVYSELSNIPVHTPVDERVGCISNNTIKVRNGTVFFMSEHGWRQISNGRMVRKSENQDYTLGDGAIDDIFSRVGSTNELNLPQSSRFFSAYYPTNSQYITWICEGSSTTLTKAYVYEERISGFRIFTFKTAMLCACDAETDSGYQCITMGDDTGTLFNYSFRSSRHDEDNTGASQTIPAYAVLPYIQPGEISNSFNFRNLAVRCFASSNNITVNCYPTFSTETYSTFNYDVTGFSTGFILDTSALDVDVLADETTIVTAMADVNLTGEVLLVKFSQDILDANIGIIAAEIQINKNGNRNT